MHSLGLLMEKRTLVLAHLGQLIILCNRANAECMFLQVIPMHSSAASLHYIDYRL